MGKPRWRLPRGRRLPTNDQRTTHEDVADYPERVDAAACLVARPQRPDRVGDELKEERSEQHVEAGVPTPCTHHQSQRHHDHRHAEHRAAEARQPIQGSGMTSAEDGLVHRAPHHGCHDHGNGHGVEPAELVARHRLGAEQDHQTQQLNHVRGEEDDVDDGPGVGSGIHCNADEIDDFTNSGKRHACGQHSPGDLAG